MLLVDALRFQTNLTYEIGRKYLVHKCLDRAKLGYTSFTEIIYPFAVDRFTPELQCVKNNLDALVEHLQDEGLKVCVTKEDKSTWSDLQNITVHISWEE